MNVEGATHKQVVDYIRSGGDTLALTGNFNLKENILITSASYFFTFYSVVMVVFQ